jgi:catalase
MTTAFGIPVGDDQNSLTAGQRGPVLMQDTHLLEKLGHFDGNGFRTRGACQGRGGLRLFEVTADVTRYTKARFLSQCG